MAGLLAYLVRETARLGVDGLPATQTAAREEIS
jgi:hypothetical protein